MSRLSDTQKALAEALKAHTGFPAALAILARREKEVANDIEAAIEQQGICIYVMMPMPKRATRTQNDIVFFESAECRIRVIERPKLNLGEFDGWDAMEQVILALQGINPDGIFAAPLGLMQHPVENVEDKTTRIFDVRFDAAFQLNS